MQRVRGAALRVVIVSVVLTALTSTGCTTWTTGDWSAPSPRLYRSNDGYVPNHVNHDFGSGGP